MKILYRGGAPTVEGEFRVVLVGSEFDFVFGWNLTMQWICRADFDMADVEVLTVRFHFNGEFVLDGSQMQYCT